MVWLYAECPLLFRKDALRRMNAQITTAVQKLMMRRYHRYSPASHCAGARITSCIVPGLLNCNCSAHLL
jgi:hypothetical protein